MDISLKCGEERNSSATVQINMCVPLISENTIGTFSWKRKIMERSRGEIREGEGCVCVCVCGCWTKHLQTRV